MQPGACSTTCIEIPQPVGLAGEPWSLHKVWGLLKCFGPAAILASMSIGAGETIVVVRTGAWAGYDLLWVVLLACLTKGVFVTYMLGRYTAISGQHIGPRLVQLPGPRGWFLLLIVGVEILFAPLAWVAIAKPCGDLMYYLFGAGLLRARAGTEVGPTLCINLYTTLFITSALLVSLTLTYQRLEKEQLVICGILVSGTMIGTAMVWPDFWAAAKGTLLRIGRFPATTPAWAPSEARNYPWLNLATVFAYVGGSVSGYLAYANWVGIRRWGLTGHPQIEQIRQRAAGSRRIDYLPDDPEQRRRLYRLAMPLCWDVALGAAVLFIVTAAFMVSGAAALYEQHSRFDGWSLLTNQAYIWRNIHPWLVPVYYITVIAALWGTLTALPEVYARVAHQFGQAIWPENRWTYEGVRALIAGLILVGSEIIIWWGLKFDLLIQLAGLFVANLAVAAAAVAAFYLNHKLPPAYRVRGMTFACALASTAILVVAALMSTYGLARKLVRPLTGGASDVLPARRQEVVEQPAVTSSSEGLMVRRGSRCPAAGPAEASRGEAAGRLGLGRRRATPVRPRTTRAAARCWSRLARAPPGCRRLMIAAELAQCLAHGQNIFHRHIGLDVVHGVENKAAAGRQVVEAPFHLVPHLLRCSVG